MNNTDRVAEIKADLCSECPDAPMDACPCGCMKKATINLIGALISQYEALTAELEQKTRDVAQLALESVERRKQLSELEAEVRHLVDAEKDGRLVVLPPHENEDYDGLKVKYRVYKARSGKPVEDCFVLRPEKEIAARAALMCYADCCGNPELARDIEIWMDSIIERQAALSADGVE